MHDLFRTIFSLRMELLERRKRSSIHPTSRNSLKLTATNVRTARAPMPTAGRMSEVSIKVLDDDFGIQKVVTGNNQSGHS